MTDQQITESLQTLLQETQPPTFTSLNAVVEHLEAKLGQSLSHKADFIRSQIQRLLFQPPQKDHFALHHNGPFFQPNPTPPSPSSSTLTFSSPAVSADAQKQSGAIGKPVKKRGGPGGLNKLCGVSPELQPIVGEPALPRTEIVKKLWAYIRRNNLQDPNNKRRIICNDELRVVFETDCTDMFKMNKLLAKHIIPLEPSKQSAKKQKVSEEPGHVQTMPGPSVRISEVLADIFEVNVREMPQSEVFTRLWEYIRIHHLEDPVNSMVICCDAKLGELFGCQSLPASRIPEVLGCKHIYRIP